MQPARKRGSVRFYPRKALTKARFSPIYYLITSLFQIQSEEKYEPLAF